MIEVTIQTSPGGLSLPTISDRILSTILDYTLFSILFIGYVFLMGAPDPTGENIYVVTGLPAIGGPLLWLLYFVGCEYFFGRTIGKLPTRLRVVQMNGEKPSMLKAFQRRVSDLIDFSFLGLPAYITTRNNPLKQRLGDLWAGTVVIKDIHTTCPYCGSNVEIVGKEVLRGRYECPVCNRLVSKESE